MRKRTKAQSAMEYLMTYGWAILIIAVVLGALFQLGVFNSSSFSPRAPPGACQVFRPSGPGTTTNINLMGVCTGQLPQYAAQFNGQTSYVDVSNLNLNLVNAISISVWVNYKAYGVNHDSEIVTKRATDWADNGYGLFYGWNNDLRWAIGDSSANTYARYDIPNAATKGWTHIVGIYDGTKLYLYVDGSYVVQATPSHGIVSNSNNMDIGGVREYLNGALANVQIYNASLSANQVQALYLEGIGGAPMKLQNLVGWWPLNGNSNDYSGNNNNGVPTGVTFTSQYGK